MRHQGLRICSGGGRIAGALCYSEASTARGDRRMTKIDLPEGVPADNQTKASFGGGDFEAPDMATPSFAREKPAFDHKAKRIVREEYEEMRRNLTTFRRLCAL